MGRREWLITALVVLGLCAAGLYANHEAGSNAPPTQSDTMTQSDPTKEPVASVPAGVESPAGGAEATTKGGSKTHRRGSDNRVEKSLTKHGAVPPASSGDDGSEEAKEAAVIEDGREPRKIEPARSASTPDQQATKPPKVNEPADAPAVRHTDRYGANREPYEGVPASEASPTSNDERYGGRESSEGVPPGQAPETR